MRIVDIHTHLYHEPDLNIEASLSNYDIESIATRYVERIRSGPANYAVAIIMDDEFLRDPEATSDLLSVYNDSDIFSLAFLLDPVADSAPEYVDRIAEAGGIAVKLHPYIQELTPETYPSVARTMRAVEERDLITIIDCSYGGQHMNRANGVHLGHKLAQVVNSPILLAHGGGPRIIDAVASADTFPNVYLDTSFSLGYWDQSSVIDDYAFGYRKLGADRWLWGSDRPYVEQSKSFERASDFLDEYKLTDRNMFFGKTAMDLIQ
jgi:predicted TIM-barrel fold metal-dependent hydrolase